MRYAQMREYDIANGPGIRCTLFVSGCTRNCKGCFNKEYQDFNYGSIWDDAAKEKFMSYVTNERVSGVTILGGEPMEQDDDLLQLLKAIKGKTNKNIWIFSGYTYEQLLERGKEEVLKYCDVLVDGQFIESKKDLKLRFKGSSNQRTIDLNKTREIGTIVLYDFD